MIRSKHLLLIVFRKVCEDMRRIKYFLSIMAVLVLLTGCSEKSETSGKEEKETTVDASAAAEQVQTEETQETQQAAQAPAEATEQPAEPSGESDSAEDTSKVVSSNSNTAASTNETPASNTAPSVKQAQESSSKSAASTQTTASQPSQGSAASQPSQAPAPAAAPSQPASEPQQEQKKETATVTLSIRDNGTMILSKTTVELQKGDTVFAVLARTVKQRGIQMEYTGTGANVYVEGINNLYEMDRGPLSGWRYYVNGVLGTRSAGDVKLSKGDKVEWRYTNDYKKEGQ